jgi:thiol:disulfide interchange protein DsbD
MNKSLAVLLCCACLSLSLPALAKPWWVQGVASNDQDFLAPDDAFQVSADLDSGVLRVRWVIADGYYLYRQQMQILAESPDLTVGPAQWPRGTVQTDQFMGTQEVFLQQVEATASLVRRDYGAHPVQVKVVYQGCAKAGLCYPIIAKVLFPAGPATVQLPPVRTPLPWQLAAILGGCGAFLIAGLRLRKS